MPFCICDVVVRRLAALDDRHYWLSASLVRLPLQVLMSMFAAVFSSNDIARVASSALKWWLMPVIFLHAVVSKP
jgi:hypothetical protein